MYDSTAVNNGGNAYDRAAIQIDTIAMNANGIHAGDRLFLGSDGLYKNLSDKEIAAGLNGSADTATALGAAAFARLQPVDNRRSTQNYVSAIGLRLGD